MKNKLWTLFKTSVVNTFKFKKMSNKKKILISLLVIYVGFSLIFTIFSVLNTIFNTLSEANLTSYYLIILFALTSLFTFFFTIFSAKSCLFDNKDNNLLLSLPIKKTTILLCRLLIITGYNFILSLFFLIPGVGIYLTNVNGGVVFYISIVLMIIALPIIPTILSSLFGYLVAYITSRVRRKNIIEMICYILFIAIYLLFMNKANSLLTLFTTNVSLMNNILKYVFFPLYLLSKGILNNNILYTIYFVLINLVILYLFIKVFGVKYFKIIFNLSAEKTRSNFKMKELASSSSYKALIKKELKKYFSSAIYVFNTAFGLVFILIFAVGSFIYNPSQILEMLNFGFKPTSFILVLYFMMFVVGMTITTNSAISIERKSFWILKMLPVEVKQIFNAKKFVNKIITIPVVLISLILLIFSSYITIPEALGLMIICIIYNAFIANFGLICNLMFPNFNAINDTVIVKQSVASFIGIIFPLLLVIIMIVLTSGLNVNNIFLIGLYLVISLVLYIISRVMLNTWGIKKFNKLS